MYFTFVTRIKDVSLFLQPLAYIRAHYKFIVGSSLYELPKSLKVSK